jgi:uncharacterized peroxidase-related enzyme
VADADRFVHAVVSDWQTAPITLVDRALCEYAAKLTHHQHRMEPADLDRLRAHGLDDSAIHDATQVVAYFNYITRIADALGVEPEDFIPPWGPSRAADGRDTP